MNRKKIEVLTRHIPDYLIVVADIGLGVYLGSLPFMFLAGLYAGVVVKTIAILFRGIDLVEETKDELGVKINDAKG